MHWEPPSEVIARIRKAIDTDESLLIATDNDLDGITAITQLESKLAPLVSNIECVYRDEHNKQIPDELIRELNPELIILLDLRTEGSQNRYAKIADTISIDHHKPSDKVPSKIILYNPAVQLHEFEESPSACILVDRTLEAIGLADDTTRLLAYLGAFGDRGIALYMQEGEPTIYNSVPERYREVYPDWLKIRRVGKSNLPILEGTLVADALSYRIRLKGPEDTHNLLSYYISKDSRTESILKFLESIVFTEQLEAQYELLTELKLDVSSSSSRSSDGSREGDNNSRFVILENPTKLPTGVVANYLATYRELVAVVYNKFRHHVIISGRVPYHFNINLQRLFAKFGGGGHPRASALRLQPVSKLTEFITEAKRYLQTEFNQLDCCK